MNNGISLKRKLKSAVLNILMYLATGLICLMLLGIIGYILIRGIPNISLKLLVVEAESYQRYNRNTAEHLKYAVYHIDNACYCTSNRRGRGGISE